MASTIVEDCLNRRIDKLEALHLELIRDMSGYSTTVPLIARVEGLEATQSLLLSDLDLYFRLKRYCNNILKHLRKLRNAINFKADIPTEEPASAEDRPSPCIQGLRRLGASRHPSDISRTDTR